MNRLREIMLLKRITQERLSEMTGVSRSDISKIINDKKDITLTTAKKIAKAVGKPIDYIWPD